MDVVRTEENGQIRTGSDEVVAAVHPFRWAESQFRSLFENAGVGIFQCTPEGYFIHVNPYLAHLFGYDHPGDIIAMESHPFNTLYANAKRRAALFIRLADPNQPDEVRDYESEALLQDGNRVWVSENIRAIRTRSGDLVYFEGTVFDITARKRAEEQVQWQAYHDALTELPNRVRFREALEQSLGYCRLPASTPVDSEDDSERGCVALLLFDIDRFKQVNDTLGHISGDKLLQQVTARLRDALPPGTLLARMGGDEFITLLTGRGRNQEETAQDAIHVADTLLAALTAPFRIEGYDLYVSASFGICIAPRDGQDTETLIKHADIALYRAKAGGRGRYEMFSKTMNEGPLNPLEIETALRHAIERGELTLLYQPQVDTKSGRLVAAEALLRWHHPELGLLLPDAFLPLAEETGLIEPVGDHALRTACERALHWSKIGQELPVCVNLTPRQFVHPRLIAQVERALKTTGLPPHLLILEMTEGAVRESGAAAQEVLRGLRGCGVGLVISDFGETSIPLAQLRRFPTDGVKLSRSIVKPLLDTEQDTAIARALLDLAHALGLRTIAVGVEKEEQRLCLEQLGCDRMQGYLYARPVSADTIESLLRENGS